MPRRSIRGEEQPPDIDLSPLIDCVFILLIFFIVTTVFVEEQGLQVEKPDAAVSAAFEEKKNVDVEITADNEVLIDGSKVDLSEVRDRVRERVVDEETPVVIRAHAKTAHGVFMNVWDAARRGGAVALSFNTVD